MLSVVVDEQARSELALDLDELVLQGARRLLAAALEAEVAAYIEAYAQERDERGHRTAKPSPAEGTLDLAEQAATHPSGAGLASRGLEPSLGATAAAAWAETGDGGGGLPLVPLQVSAGLLLPVLLR
jgi:hypothetical protein